MRIATFAKRSLRECQCQLGKTTPTGAAPRVDRARGLIRGVKILSRESRNNRVYTADCLARARRLYEGVSVRVNHPDPSDDEADRDRDADDVLGRLVNVRVAPDGLYGDLEYLRTHPMSGRLAEAAERMPSAYGLSHNVGEWKGSYDQSGKYVVTDILLVESVDLVADPATTRSLFESHRPRKGRRMKLLEWMRKQKPQVRATVRRLIESDSMDGSMLMDDTADPEVAIASAFRAAVNAVLDDATGNVASKMGKLKEILTAQEKLMASGAITPTVVDDLPADDLPVEDEGLDDADALDDDLDVEDDGELDLEGDPDGDDDEDDLVESDQSETDEELEDEYEDRPKKPAKKMESLRRENQRLKAREKSRSLCESMKVVPTPVLLKALEKMDSDTERRQLLRESRRTRATGRAVESDNFAEAITVQDDDDQ